MKAEYQQEGKILNYTNPTEDFIEAGTLIIYGDICGIAATDMASGQLGTIATTGVWKMPKDKAAITGGAKVYYDEENNVVTATASAAKETSNVFVGICVEEADTTAAFAYVRLNG